MLLTNQQILDIYENLNGVKDDTSKLPIKVSYAVIRNLNTLKNIATDIDQARQNMISNFKGTLDKEAGIFKIDPEDIPEADKQLKELAMIQNDVNIRTCPLSLLDNYDIDLKMMNALFFMLEGEG